MPLFSPATTVQIRQRPAIIAFDANDWTSNWMNRQHLLSRLGKRGWPVIYSTGALSISDRHSPQWQSARWTWQTRRADGVILPVPSRLPPRWSRWARWDRIAIAAHAWRLKHMLLRGQRAASVALLFNPAYYPYLDMLAPKHVIFHVRDAFERLPGWGMHQQQNYLALQRRADIVSVSSQQLVSLLDPAVRDRARLLANAADVESFRRGTSAPCPADLAAIPRPRLGYVGVISLKVDLALIGSIADAHPAWHWVFVGSVPGSERGTIGGDPQAFAIWQQFLRRPNVHWLGPRTHTEVPPYVAHMDVNTMPYVTDTRAGGWARYAYPLKLHEYLATGLPVVSANLPELYVHRDVLDIADGRDAWIAALQRALSGNSPGSKAARQALAAQHSWDRRVELFESWLHTLISADEA